MPSSRIGSTIAKQWLAPAPDDAETYPGHEIRLMLAREYLELEAENERIREALDRILDCTYTIIDPNHWHILHGKGREFSRAIKDARALLRASNSDEKQT